MIRARLAAVHENLPLHDLGDLVTGMAPPMILPDGGSTASHPPA